jgi:integrase
VLSAGAMGVFRAALRAWKDFFGKRPGRAAVRLDEITPSLFLDYRAWRTTARNSLGGPKRPVSPTTINADHRSLVRILNEAVLDGQIEKNPLAGMKKLRAPQRPRRYLTKEELGALIANCPDHFKPFLVTAAYTGARKGELTRLRWSDLDFEGKKIALFRPKVGNADWIDMHPAVEAELMRLRKTREEGLAERGEKVLPEHHVFLSWHGTPYREIRRSWQLALKAAGLDGRPGLTPHALRHSFATHYLQGGGAVTDLQQQLGHAELATTQIYASALSARRRASVMALDFGG